MNTQNILKFFGSKLDVKLDSSEFYDYEISKTTDDYNLDVLDLSKSITYSSLIIDDTLSYMDCVRDTIELTEFDNTVNDNTYIYSGLTLGVNYESFVNQIGTNYHNIILNKDIFTYTGITGETHYFYISGYNVSPYLNDLFNAGSELEVVSGFTSNTIKCIGKLSNDNFCCPKDIKMNAKPYVYQFKQNECTTDIIKRRTEKGWTLDFVFNRESLSWSNGGVFYYLGTRGSNNPSEYGDNNLSFQFTSDGRIKWVTHHYSGICGTSGYEESYYVASGQTPQLCTTGSTKDFNITIVFDRYKRFTNCDIENNGGWNDLLGWKFSDYSDTNITAVTSNQITQYESVSEFLNKKWADEKQRRLGILKIYLNGKPIYKIENWEEVVASNRGTQPFIQSWGGGTGLMSNLHQGVCCFNVKSIKYYEEPLDFVHVRHNFLTRLNQYDFFICGQNCQDEISGYLATGIINENGDFILTENNDIILY